VAKGQVFLSAQVFPVRYISSTLHTHRHLSTTLTRAWEPSKSYVLTKPEIIGQKGALIF